MLSPHTLDVIRRDPELQGLSLVLDTDILSAVLANVLPGSDVHSGEVSYIRYKPGRRCLVLFQAVTDGRARQFVATAHDDGHWSREVLRADRERTAGTRGNVHLVTRHHVTVTEFPNDPSIRILPRLHDAGTALAVMARLFPNEPHVWQARILPLAYKPARRFVGLGQVEGIPHFALKAYASSSSRLTKQQAKPFVSRSLLRVPNRIARSRRHRLVAYEWMDGPLLAEAMCCPGFGADKFVHVGTALAELHQQDSPGLSLGDSTQEVASIGAVAADVAFLLPELRSQLQDVARRTGRQLRESTTARCPIHGDFYAKQVLLCDGKIGIVDFDQATIGDPGRDLGNFIAKLIIAGIRDDITSEVVERYRESFLRGYRQQLTVDERSLPFHIAAGLIRCLPYPFRQGLLNWPAQTNAILETIESMLAATERSLTFTRQNCDTRRPVSRQDGLLSDTKLPQAAAALDLRSVQSSIEGNIPQLRNRYGTYSVTRARVLRHKWNRRCLIQYTLLLANSQTPDAELTLIGKMRSKGLDRRTYEVQRQLWERGFNDRSSDAVAVPEPLGVISELAMWLQPMIPGITATHLLNRPDHDHLAEQIALALAKLHATSVPTTRQHTLNDELRILHERIAQTSAIHPKLSSPLRTLFGQCQRIVNSIHQRQEKGIHRDFYPDQVLIADDRIYLLDLDLYTNGDPSLDAGNFVGHLIEQAIRCPQDEEQLREFAQRFSYSFSRMTRGDEESIDRYAILTLARHVALSTVIPGRSHTTHRILEWCNVALSSR